MNPEAANRGARAWIPTVLGIGISLALLFWSLRGVSPQEVWLNVRAAAPLTLLAAVILATLTFPLRLLRWRLLLRQDDDTILPYGPGWHAIAIGFMANNLLPFRAGEFLRTYTISRLARVRFTSALTSVAVERVFDGIGVVATLVLALFTAHLPADLEIGGIRIAATAERASILCLVILILGGLVVALPTQSENLIRKLIPAPKVADKLVSIVEGLRLGLSALRSPSRLLGVMAWSLTLWLLNGFSFYVGAKAFNLPVDFPGILLMQGLLVFGIAVPSSPGFVGIFEAAVIAGLSLYGIGKDRAVSYALTYHLTTFLPITLLGLWSLAKTPISLGDFRRSRK